MRLYEPPTRDEFAAMLRLAAPVVAVQVGLMLMGVVDTMVVGRVSAEALAGVALGNLAVFAVSAFGIGLLMALDPLVSQAIGARDTVAVRRSIQRGFLIAAAVAVPSVLALVPVGQVLTLLRQPPEAVTIATGYVHRCLPGLLPLFFFVVLRQTLQAMQRMRPIVTVVVLANLLNLVLAIAMVHGRWGFSPMGAFGTAWATTASRTVLFVGLAVAARHDLAPLLGRIDREAFRVQPIWRMVALGAPIGLQIQLEWVAFGVIALMMGGLGTAQMAAHQVAINLASLTFMVPLGVAAATSVRVGRAVGSGDGLAARRAATAGLVCGAGFMTLTALLFLSLPGQLAAAYTPQAEVISVAALLIPIAGVFQVFDGLQVVASGILRGLADTRAPMAINLAGFWLVGVPVSLGLGFGLDLGPQGLWWGLVFGLAAVAGLLLLRITSRLSRRLERVAVDEPV